MTRDEMIDIIDTLVWQCRGTYGHDDNGLEDYDTGEEIADGIHPEVREVVDIILQSQECQHPQRRQISRISGPPLTFCMICEEQL